MKQDYKLYAGVGAMLVLGIAVYMVMGDRSKAAEARSVQAAQDLPVVKLSQEEAAKVTKFVLTNKDKGSVTLEKKGDDWMITAPIQAKANQGHVNSVISNLEKIELTAIIGANAAQHEKYELTDKTSVHVQAFKGDAKVLDMHFGKSGTRGGGGAMARMGADGSKPTIFGSKGFSAYVWGRELKNWRHNEILKFDEGNAIAVEVETEEGKLSFVKTDDEWSGKLYKRGEKGLAEKPVDLERFDDKSVSKLLQAYQGLKATDFAEKKDDTGVDAAVKNGGGIIRIILKDEDKPKFVVHVGKAQEGTNRFVKVEGDKTVYVVTSLLAEWAFKMDKFQTPEEKKDEGDDDDDAKKDGKKDAKKDGKKDGKKDAKKDAPKPAKKDAPKPKTP